jgi:hypothetical protein
MIRMMIAIGFLLRDKDRKYLWSYFLALLQKVTKRSSAVFLSLRFTSEISTTSVITSVLPRGTRISERFTCFKNKATFRLRSRYRLKIEEILN